MLEKIAQFRDFINNSKYSKAVSFLLILFLTAAIPLTAYLAQQQQDIRQRAQEAPTTPPFPPSPTPTPAPNFGNSQSLAAELNGASNVPVVATNGTGNATLILAPDGTTAKVYMSYANLTSPVNAAHIHGPATTTQTAGILYPLNFNPATSGSNLVTTITGITPQQVTDLINGLWYINVHTNNFPGGEIRGQISASGNPAPSYIGLAITSISSGTPGPTSATITWETSVPTDGRVYYSSTSAFPIRSPSKSVYNPGFVFLHTVTLTGLTPATLYHYAVVSYDETDEYITSSVGTFTTAPTPIPPTPTPISSSSKRIFVSNGSYPVNLGGLNQYDAMCQQEADQSSLGGTWRAWMSDNNTSAASRLTHSTSPYVLLDGTRVANDWSDLTDGSIQSQINLRLNGSRVTTTPLTGTSPTGSSTLQTCGNWTSTDFSQVASTGLTTITDGRWTQYSTTRCVTSPIVIYCFEQ